MLPAAGFTITAILIGSRSCKHGAHGRELDHPRCCAASSDVVGASLCAVRLRHTDRETTAPGGTRAIEVGTSRESRVMSTAVLAKE
jgi:hypothetical protein